MLPMRRWSRRETAAASLTLSSCGEDHLLDHANDPAARLRQEFLGRKIDVPEAHFDRLASPVASFAVITTVDENRRVNAAPVATCLRNNHHPTCFEFTMDASKHTAENIQATAEFVVNIVPFDRAVLEKVQVTALGFPKGVDELKKAGLTAIPSKIVKPPRIGECLSHFECQVEWTKQWLGSRVTIVGRVVAASVDRGCVDDKGLVIHERLRTAQHCGQIYGSKFIGGQEVMEIAMIYDGPDPKSCAPDAAS
jgi:flavin reductase (DIM6/NTAB) family NADH-FMN oxidoreductase RutF